MCEHHDSDPPDRVKGGQTEACIPRREPVQRPSRRDDHEGEFVVVERVNVADRGAGKLQGEVAVAPGEVVACKEKKRRMYPQFGRLPLRIFR